MSTDHELIPQPPDDASEAEFKQDVLRVAKDMLLLAEGLDARGHLEAEVERLTGDLAAARETNARLNHRCQEAERLAGKQVEIARRIEQWQTAAGPFPASLRTMLHAFRASQLEREVANLRTVVADLGRTGAAVLEEAARHHQALTTAEAAFHDVLTSARAAGLLPEPS